jgi:hypothetical protein
MKNIVKQFNQKTFAMAIGTGIFGVLVTMFGLSVMLIRVKLAVAFLGARALFDMPFDQSDATKIGIVTLVALGILLWGVGMIATGTIISLAQYSHKQQTQTTEQTV